MTQLDQSPGLAPVLKRAAQSGAINDRPASAARTYAMRDTLAVASGMVAFGLMLGVTISTLRSDPIAGLAGTFVVYGGSAQLTAVTLLHQGIAFPAAVLTAAIVNLRLLLYSAALGERFRRQPRLFRWLAPHLIIDQTYLMASGRPTLSDAEFRRYWRWLGGTVLVIWFSSVATGIAIGPVMPKLPHLTLVATALFIGM